jgi:hypothetical protein
MRVHGHPPKMRKIKNVADLTHGIRINFNNICEIIQTSDGFSRHLEALRC